MTATNSYEKFFASVQLNGPAIGIGRTAEEARAMASRSIAPEKWEDEGEFQTVEITEDSYRAILDGDPDAYEIVE